MNKVDDSRGPLHIPSTACTHHSILAAMSTGNGPQTLSFTPAAIRSRCYHMVVDSGADQRVGEVKGEEHGTR